MDPGPSSQVATAVEGAPERPAMIQQDLTVQNDLFAGASLSVDMRSGYQATWHPAAAGRGLSDDAANGLAHPDAADADPDDPRGIALDDAIRGRLKAKKGGAIIGLAIGF